MGAELHDVEVNLDGVVLAYATKISSKKNKDNNTTLTFDGDVSTSGANTGGSISIERLYWPKSVEEAILLEEKLESKVIKTITCRGTSYTANGDPYTRIITGTNVKVDSDEDEWSPSDGMSQKLELIVDKLERKSIQ